MSGNARQITFKEALDEALWQSMQRDPSILVMGCGVDDCKGIFGTTLSATRRFGARVIDTPLAENAVTGIGVGLALNGMRPVLVHARNDFLLLTMDQIVNHAAKWRYMTAGKLSVPFTIRAIVGRGWGQAAQHSQSLQALFAHVPGLKLTMPANAYDAKGLLAAALQDPDPVLQIEHRWLFDHKAEVPEQLYTVPIGRARVAREGRDVTIVAISHMVHEALQAAQSLQQEGISVEVIDLRSVRPWDEAAVIESVRKTRRLIVADTAWKSFGVSAEIAARVQEALFGELAAPVARVSLPDVPTPCSSVLEKAYYPGSAELQAAARNILRSGNAGRLADTVLAGNPNAVTFEGPF